MVNKIVVAIIAVEFQKELRMVREHETFLGRLFFYLYDPSGDVFSSLGIVEIGFCHDT